MGRQRGFTLIELMITVLIIGMILSVAIPNFRLAHLRSRENALRADLSTYRSAVFAFLSDTGCYPALLTHLDDTSAPATCHAVGGGSTSYRTFRWRGPYIASVTVDPVSRTPFNYTPSSGRVASSAAGNDTRGTAYSSY